jgi:fumarate hydratase class II
MSFREEQDSMGVVQVPAGVHYGSQTQRAVENFPASGLIVPLPLIHALARIKRQAATVNKRLGLLPDELATAIAAAAEEIQNGDLDDQFVVDLFQTGSGTSTNMNMNEVVASRANEMLTGRRGGRSPVHPNDHVNQGQSSNDVIPTALHLAVLLETECRLRPALDILAGRLGELGNNFADIPKIGRTHLQDAVPMTMGQAFSGYARQAEAGGERLQAVRPRLCELALGGTAVGTGINTHPEFATEMIKALGADTGLPLRRAKNPFEAQAARDAAVETSGALRTIAASLVKIANDLRWLASGPRCGIGELKLPALQPGSSIMPGKVNPVIPEAVIQISYQVMGNDTTVMLAGQAGNFELNVTLPLLAHSLLESIRLLGLAARQLTDRCLDRIEVDVTATRGYIEDSLALVTGFVPHLGYDKAAALAKQAYADGRTVRAVVLESGLLAETVINQVLGPPPEDH